MSAYHIIDNKIFVDVADLDEAIRFLEMIRDGAEDEWPALNDFLARVSVDRSERMGVALDKPYLRPRE